MGYYAGGYYAGGYYAGGLFSTIGHAIGGIAKVGLGAGLGLITGGPKGAITGALGAGVSVAKEGIARETLAAGGSGSALTPELKMKHAAALARGGAGGGAPKPAVALMSGGMPSQMAIQTWGGMPIGGGGMLPMAMDGFLRGYRWNKSTYAVRGGGTSRWPVGLQLIPRHSVAVKSRRMNVANPRALRRALRRASGFAKLARRYVRVTASFKKTGARKKKR